MKKLDERVKLLTERYPEIWPTEASVWSYIRGGLRRGLWEKAPNKFAFKNSHVSKPPEGYTGRAKSGAECALTGEWTGKSKLEVDHVKGHKSLRCEDDVIEYILHLLAVEEELQLASVEAHKVKSYAERMDITFEEAVQRKKEIAFGKLTLPQMKAKLREMNVKNIPNTKTACVKLFKETL